MKVELTGANWWCSTAKIRICPRRELRWPNAARTRASHPLPHTSCPRVRDERPARIGERAHLPTHDEYPLLPRRCGDQRVGNLVVRVDFRRQ